MGRVAATPVTVSVGNRMAASPVVPDGAMKRGIAEPRGILVGALAGLVGIACCVTPTALVLLGLSTVSFAISFGNTLYYQYGWYFRLAGLSVGAIGVIKILQARKSCSLRGVRQEWRLFVVVAVTTVVVYAALYGLTTWLAWLASPV